MVKRERLKKKNRRFEKKMKQENKKLFNLEKFVSSPRFFDKY